MYVWFCSNVYFWLIFQVPPMTNYSMQGRTYRFFEGRPLYSFGYGLSYSRFHYSNLQVIPKDIEIGQDVAIKFDLTNHGPYDAEEVNM